MILELRFGFVALGIFLAANSASDASERTNRVSAIRVPVRGTLVKAQTGPDGTIHLLLDSDDGPRYIKSLTGGATFSQPIAIVNASAQKPGLKYSGWDLMGRAQGRQAGAEAG